MREADVDVDLVAGGDPVEQQLLLAVPVALEPARGTGHVSQSSTTRVTSRDTSARRAGSSGSPCCRQRRS